jgi:hypothetical protein
MGDPLVNGTTGGDGVAHDADGLMPKSIGDAAKAEGAGEARAVSD